MPIDNDWAEKQIRPWALGRKNWLFAGSLRSGKRAAVIMSLIQPARLNGHDPYAYLKDVLTRLPSQRASVLRAFRPKPRLVSVLYPTRTHLAPQVDAFVDWLKKHFPVLHPSWFTAH